MGNCAVVVVVCDVGDGAVLELMSQLLFLWRRDVKKWEGEGKRILVIAVGFVVGEE